MEMVRNEIMEKPAWKAYRTTTLDTLKIYTFAHGSKTTNLVVNLEDDPKLWFDDLDKPLIHYSIENETELSFFNKALYDEYLAQPDSKW